MEKEIKGATGKLPLKQYVCMCCNSEPVVSLEGFFLFPLPAAHLLETTWLLTAATPGPYVVTLSQCAAHNNDTAVPTSRDMLATVTVTDSL